MDEPEQKPYKPWKWPKFDPKQHFRAEEVSNTPSLQSQSLEEFLLLPPARRQALFDQFYWHWKRYLRWRKAGLNT